MFTWADSVLSDIHVFCKEYNIFWLKLYARGLHESSERLLSLRDKVRRQREELDGLVICMDGLIPHSVHDGLREEARKGQALFRDLEFQLERIADFGQDQAEDCVHHRVMIYAMPLFIAAGLVTPFLARRLPGFGRILSEALGNWIAKLDMKHKQALVGALMGVSVDLISQVGEMAHVRKKIDVASLVGSGVEGISDAYVASKVIERLIQKAGQGDNRAVRLLKVIPLAGVSASVTGSVVGAASGAAEAAYGHIVEHENPQLSLGQSIAQGVRMGAVTGGVQGGAMGAGMGAITGFAGGGSAGAEGPNGGPNGPKSDDSGLAGSGLTAPRDVELPQLSETDRANVAAALEQAQHEGISLHNDQDFRPVLEKNGVSARAINWILTGEQSATAVSQLGSERVLSVKPAQLSPAPGDETSGPHASADVGATSERPVSKQPGPDTSAEEAKPQRLADPSGADAQPDKTAQGQNQQLAEPDTRSVAPQNPASVHPSFVEVPLPSPLDTDVARQWVAAQPSPLQALIVESGRQTQQRLAQILGPRGGRNADRFTAAVARTSTPGELHARVRDIHDGVLREQYDKLKSQIPLLGKLEARQRGNDGKTPTIEELVLRNFLLRHGDGFALYQNFSANTPDPAKFADPQAFRDFLWHKMDQASGLLLLEQRMGMLSLVDQAAAERMWWSLGGPEVLKPSDLQEAGTVTVDPDAQEQASRLASVLRERGGPAAGLAYAVLGPYSGGSAEQRLSLLLSQHPLTNVDQLPTSVLAKYLEVAYSSTAPLDQLSHEVKRVVSRRSEASGPLSVVSPFSEIYRGLTFKGVSERGLRFFYGSSRDPKISFTVPYFGHVSDGKAQLVDLAFQGYIDGREVDINPTDYASWNMRDLPANLGKYMGLGREMDTIEHLGRRTDCDLLRPWVDADGRYHGHDLVIPHGKEGDRTFRVYELAPDSGGRPYYLLARRDSTDSGNSPVFAFSRDDVFFWRTLRYEGDGLTWNGVEKTLNLRNMIETLEVADRYSEQLPPAESFSQILSKLEERGISRSQLERVLADEIERQRAQAESTSGQESESRQKRGDEPRGQGIWRNPQRNEGHGENVPGQRRRAHADGFRYRLDHANRRSADQPDQDSPTPDHERPAVERTVGSKEWELNKQSPLDSDMSQAWLEKQPPWLQNVVAHADVETRLKLARLIGQPSEGEVRTISPALETLRSMLRTYQRAKEGKAGFTQNDLDGFREIVRESYQEFENTAWDLFYHRAQSDRLLNYLINTVLKEDRAKQVFRDFLARGFSSHMADSDSSARHTESPWHLPFLDAAYEIYDVNYGGPAAFQQAVDAFRGFYNTLREKWTYRSTPVDREPHYGELRAAFAQKVLAAAGQNRQVFATQPKFSRFLGEVKEIVNGRGEGKSELDFFDNARVHDVSQAVMRHLPSNSPLRSKVQELVERYQVLAKQIENARGVDRGYRAEQQQVRLIKQGLMKMVRPLHHWGDALKLSPELMSTIVSSELNRLMTPGYYLHTLSQKQEDAAPFRIIQHPRTWPTDNDRVLAVALDHDGVSLTRELRADMPLADQVRITRQWWKHQPDAVTLEQHAPQRAIDRFRWENAEKKLNALAPPEVLHKLRRIRDYPDSLLANQMLQGMLNGSSWRQPVDHRNLDQIVSRLDEIDRNLITKTLEETVGTRFPQMGRFVTDVVGDFLAGYEAAGAGDRTRSREMLVGELAEHSGTDFHTGDNVGGLLRFLIQRLDPEGTRNNELADRLIARAMREYIAPDRMSINQLALYSDTEFRMHTIRDRVSAWLDGIRNSKQESPDEHGESGNTWQAVDKKFGFTDKNNVLSYVAQDLVDRAQQIEWDTLGLTKGEQFALRSHVEPAEVTREWLEELEGYQPDRFKEMPGSKKKFWTEVTERGGALTALHEAISRDDPGGLTREKLGHVLTFVSVVDATNTPSPVLAKYLEIACKRASDGDFPAHASKELKQALPIPDNEFAGRVRENVDVDGVTETGLRFAGPDVSFTWFFRPDQHGGNELGEVEVRGSQDPAEVEAGLGIRPLPDKRESEK